MLDLKQHVYNISTKNNIDIEYTNDQAKNNTQKNSFKANRTHARDQFCSAGTFQQVRTESSQTFHLSLNDVAMCLSVCLSQAGAVAKRLNVESHKTSYQ